MIGYLEEPDYVGLQPVIENYDPSWPFIFKKAVEKGFSDTSVMLGFSLSRMADAEKEGKITREEWQESKFYDEKIKFDDSFTYAKARLLKERQDLENEYAYYLQQSSGFDYVAGVGGLLLGSVPDPLNFLPVLGTLSAPMRALKFANAVRRLPRGVPGAADAALASSLAAPLLMAERAAYQQKYDARDALIDIGLATGVGYAFGSLFGRVRENDSFPPNRLPTREEVAEGMDASLKRDIEKMAPEDSVTRPLDSPSPITNRVQDLVETVPPEKRALAVAKTINAFGRNEPVNVAAEMQPVVRVSDVKQERILFLQEKPELTPEEMGELQTLMTQFMSEPLEFDYTVARNTAPDVLEEPELKATDVLMEEELDYAIEQAINQKRLSDVEVKEILTAEELTNEQSQKELSEYLYNLGYCVLNNG